MKKLIKDRAKGFTLVELLVVMAIIGILIAIGAPKMTEVTKGAKKTTAEANVRTIKSVMAMYQAQNAGEVPTSMAQVKAFIPGSGDFKDQPAGFTYEITADGIIQAKEGSTVVISDYSYSTSAPSAT